MVMYISRPGTSGRSVLFIVSVLASSGRRGWRSSVVVIVVIVIVVIVIVVVVVVIADGLEVVSRQLTAKSACNDISRPPIGLKGMERAP